jgi:hypothetical protein
MADIVVAGLAPDLLPYPEALALQRSIHSAVVEGTRPDTVLLLEHPSVYTAGTRTEASERPDDGSTSIGAARSPGTDPASSWDTPSCACTTRSTSSPTCADSKNCSST